MVARYRLLVSTKKTTSALALLAASLPASRISVRPLGHQLLDVCYLNPHACTSIEGGMKGFVDARANSLARQHHRDSDGLPPPRPIGETNGYDFDSRPRNLPRGLRQAHRCSHVYKIPKEERNRDLPPYS